MMINNRELKKHGTYSPRLLKFSTGILGMCLAGYIVGPPLYWHISESLNSSVTQMSCPSCHCDCLDQPLFSLPQGLNSSFLTDCMKHNPEASEESEKNFSEILAGELKQKEAEALANQQRADVALLEAKKMANQYQKDADKCNNGMETCEAARERAEDALDAQRELTMMWEMRARHRGWKADSDLTESTNQSGDAEPEPRESSDNVHNAEAGSLEGGDKVHDAEVEQVQNAEAESFEGGNVVQDTEAEVGSNVVQDAEAESLESSNKVQDDGAESLESSDKIQDVDAKAEAESFAGNNKVDAEAELLDGSSNAEDANSGAESFENSTHKAQDAEAESLESSDKIQDADAKAEAESFAGNNKVQDAEAEAEAELLDGSSKAEDANSGAESFENSTHRVQDA